MKSYYLDGHIIEYWSESMYGIVTIETARIPLLGKHPFKNWQSVIEGIDYKTGPDKDFKHSAWAL